MNKPLTIKSAVAVRSVWLWARTNKLNAALCFVVPWAIEVALLTILDGAWLAASLVTLFTISGMVLLVVMRRTAVTLLLICSLLGFGVRTKKSEANPAAGVVILVIGGVIIICITSTCQKLFGKKPARTNSEPDAIYGPVIGATYWLEPPNPYVICDEDDTNSTTYFITGTITAGGFQQSSLSLATVVVNEAEFNSAIATYGISTAVESSYSLNGVPCLPAQSPITFSNNGRNIAVSGLKNSGETRTVAFEQSNDGGRTWTETCRLKAAIGTPVRLEGNSRSALQLTRFKNL